MQTLRQAGIASGMTENGDLYENAIAERVNGILKIDFRLNRVFPTFEEAQRAVEASIRGLQSPAAAYELRVFDTGRGPRQYGAIAATLEAESLLAP